MRGINFILMVTGLSLVAMLVVGLFVMGDKYTTEVVIHRPYDEVWAKISNPEAYPELYPQWVKAVENVQPDRFTVHDQWGKTSVVTTKIDPVEGLVDLTIGGELSRTRVLKVDEGRTLVIHTATRWEEMGLLAWIFHRKLVDADFRNAKRVIEESASH